MFSFYLTKSEEHNGKVTFGGYSLRYAKQGLKFEDIIWNHLAEKADYFWSIHMRNARFYGGKPILEK